MNIESIADASGKITLNPAMVTNETIYGVAGRLVNEQELVGDPKNSTGSQPPSYWQRITLSSERSQTAEIVLYGS